MDEDRTSDDTAEREALRLAVLHQVESVATLADPVLARIVVLAAHLTGTPCAAVHLIDDEVQHRVAAVGVPLEPTPRADTFCRRVVESGAPMETLDASVDDRFAHSSFAATVGYYAAVPLAAGGEAVGTLCVWDGTTRPSTVAGSVLLGDLAAIAAGHIEALHALRTLAGAATVDPLTGLANRRLVGDRLADALAVGVRRGTDVSVVYLDLDGFKQINDEAGHAVGDEVLVEVGRRLLDTCRDGELVGRLGGDEFVLVVEGDQRAAKQAAARLGAAVAEPITTTVGVRSVGASLGVATSVGSRQSAESLLLRADAAMYLDKQRRRHSDAS